MCECDNYEIIEDLGSQVSLMRSTVDLLATNIDWLGDKIDKMATPLAELRELNLMMEKLAAMAYVKLSSEEKAEYRRITDARQNKKPKHGA